MTAFQMETINTIGIKSPPRTFLRIPPADFDLDAIFGCGQCFRWERQPDGSYCGVVRGHVLRVRQQGARLMMEGARPGESGRLWRPYFDLGRDYGAVKAVLARDPVLREAVRFSPGIRILRQEPWEALCSFLLSQNNNIPRIRGIVARLCGRFGEPLGEGCHAFPSARRLAAVSAADLRAVGCGYRAEYILDAARAVATGRLKLRELSRLPLEEARARLRSIRGVGPKVADCTLLFGCGRLDCFPRDVWIRRVLDCLYPGGFPRQLMPLGGIAQQYLFHYARCCPECGLGGRRAQGSIHTEGGPHGGGGKAE